MGPRRPLISWSRRSALKTTTGVGFGYPSQVFDFLLIGAGFAFAAAAQPGPLQAYLFAQVSAVGWRRTLPAALSPLVSDGPIAVLALLVLGRLPSNLQYGLRTLGGVLLLYLAWAALRQWRASGRPNEVAADAPRSLVGAVLVNLVNPHPYLGWTLILGPTAVTAWRAAPMDAVALIVAFYATMVASLAALILLFGTTRFLGPRSRRALSLVSAVILALIGVYQLFIGLTGLATA